MSLGCHWYDRNASISPKINASTFFEETNFLVPQLSFDPIRKSEGGIGMFDLEGIEEFNF